MTELLLSQRVLHPRADLGIMQRPRLVVKGRMLALAAGFSELTSAVDAVLSLEFLRHVSLSSPGSLDKRQLLLPGYHHRRRPF
jgi:hypothetical protein